MRRCSTGHVVATLLVTALATAPVLRAQAASPVRINPAWLHADSATSTVEFALLAGLGGLNGGMSFNGATSGALTLTVPTGWHVVLHVRNEDQNMAHSVVVIPAVTPVPAAAGRPAFAGAATRQPEQGLAIGAHEDVRFVAARPGSFMIFCAVPGHGMAGMWMRLEVSGTAAQPGVSQTRSAP